MNGFKNVRAIVLVATFAACTKSEAPKSTADSTPSAAVPATSSSLTACTIATRDEMSAAIGASVTATDEQSSNHCIFKTAEPLAYADVEIDRENADAAWQGINAGDSIISAQQDSLTGIGDKAFFGPRDRLYFRKGNAFVAVEGGFDDNARKRAIAVARLISAKL